MKDRTVPGIGLKYLVYAATVCGTLLLSIGLILFLASYSQTVTDRALDRAIQVRAQSAALDFARSIDADWQELVSLEQRLPTLPPETLRGIFDGMVGSGGRVAWVGYAGIDGRVITGSKGMLEGVDVSQRPWFQAGLQGNFAGDVHEALLLNRMLGGSEDDPIRFIDLALPVTDAAGNAIGVLATHLEAAWAERYLTESAAIRSIDLFIVNSSGSVVLSSAPAPDAPLDLQAFRAAAAGVTAITREEWQDGRSYQSSILPSVIYGTAPNFGWRLVARIPAEAFAADRSDLLRVALTLMAGCFGVVLFATIIFTQVFLAPITRIAQAALDASEGKETYPPESRSSWEANSMSIALARLQSNSRKSTKD